MTLPIRLSLITLGDPGKLTGGYLYHRRMADVAPRFDANIRFVSVPERPFPLAIQDGVRIWDEALAVSPSAVLVDSIAAAYLAPVALRRSVAVPICSILHQPPGGIDHGPLRSRLQAILDMVLYRRANKLIVASQVLEEEMRRRGIPQAALRVVPPGCNGAQPDESLPSLGDLRHGTRAAFLCVANWLPNKGIHLLLEAFAMLPKDTAILHLVGDNNVDPNYTDWIIRRLTRPDLIDRVYAHGPLPSSTVAALYRTADAFVLPSRWECYATACGEALSFGLPVVALHTGNLPYLITHGVEGILVPPGDQRALAHALLTLSFDEQLRGEMSAAAQERSLTLPTWDQSAALFFAATREALPTY